MSTELPKAYDNKTVEPQANRVWTEEKLFHAEPTDPGEPYSIVIPPPNVTAALHLGHALNNTLQDVLTRWHRMLGDNTEWMPGTDHAGIATQTVVEKRVQAEEGKRRTDFSREEFVRKIQAWKDEYERRITEQLVAMGCSCDYARQAFTMDVPRARAVREAFFRLFKDGLIYRGKRLVNWDPATQTALADDEVEMEEIDGHFYYLRYPLVEVPQAQGSALGQPQYVTVATTRPETMLGDTAVAINPKDPRAAQLRGKHVRLPIVNRIIPIIEDDYVVLPDPKSDDAKAQFATGFLKVTPAHDPNDYDIGQRHKLPMINVLGPDGTISNQHGWPADDFRAGEAAFLLGMDRLEARAAVVEWFRTHELLEQAKPYRHSVGHSYRSHVPIEPYLSDQWYCKVTDERLAGAALRAMSTDQRSSERGTGASPVQKQNDQHGQGARAMEWEGKLKFYPARYAKTFQTWHENIRDWCISRQLWWGHRIPVWRLPEGRLGDRIGTEQLAAVVDQLNRWMLDKRIAMTHRAEHPAAREQDVADKSLPFAFVCVREPDDREVIDYLERLGAQQDPDVLDTWFSSGLWPLSTFGWPDDTPELAKWNPTSVLTTAREIITLWVSRMVMFNLYFLDRLPFYDVFIHAMIQDGEGQKMSKTLGNGVDPLDIIHSHGADAMRYTLAAMTTHTQDLRMPVEMVDPHSGTTFQPQKITTPAGHVVAGPVQTSPKDAKKKMVSSFGAASGMAKPTADMPVAKNTSSKFDLGRNFCNKLWNACRFALMNLASTSADATKPTDSHRWALADLWILSRFNRAVSECDSALKEYRFDQYAKSCYDFVWRDFCDWYLEAIKPAMKDPARAAQTANVLASVTDGALRLLHPLIPFITETIWWKLNDIRPTRGVADQLPCPPSKRLIKAGWPKPGPTDEAVESAFARIQDVITAIRNVRNEHKVDPKRTISVTISAPADVARQIEDGRELIETLATAQVKHVAQNVAAPAKAARTSAAGVEIYIEGMADEAAEGQRVAKRCEDLKKQIAAMKGRLANESYIAKAPPHLVQQTKDQLADAEAEAAKLGCSG
jgi:valyl-tRNA synthetase